VQHAVHQASNDEKAPPEPISAGLFRLKSGAAEQVAQAVQGLHIPHRMG